MPAHPSHRVVIELRDVFALEADCATTGWHQPKDQSAGGRFAAARFADQRQCLAATDLEADIVDGAYRPNGLAHDHTAFEREVLDQPLNAQKGVVAHAGSPSADGLIVDSAGVIDSSTGAFQQATLCIDSSVRSGGSLAWQCASAKGQRGANRQPAG